MNNIYMLGIITNRGMREKFLQFLKNTILRLPLRRWDGERQAALFWIIWEWRQQKRRSILLLLHLTPGKI